MYYIIITSLFFRFIVLYTDALIGDAVRTAEENEFPFVVSIGYKNHQGFLENVFCTGSLIARSYVLTAAHCFEHNDLNNLQVTVGSYDVRGGEKFGVVGAMAYDKWAELKKNKIFYLRNDIGVMKLAGKLSVKVKLASLPNKAPCQLLGKTVTMVGYGMFTNGTMPRYLQTAPVRIMNHGKCTSILRMLKHQEAMQVTENILCTDSDAPTDMTVGDAGGPIFIVENYLLFKNYRLLGVNSAVYLDRRNPYSLKQTVHVGVYYYGQFIDEIVKNGNRYFRLFD